MFGQSVTIVSTPTKTAEPIEMLFGVWTRMGLGTIYWTEVQLLHEKGQF